MHSAYYSNSRIPILQSSFKQIHFPSILVSETLLRSRQCSSTSRNSILQVHQFQWQFLHSFNIAESSNRHRIQLLLQELLVSHTPFVCTHMDQGLNAEPGTFFKNKDSTWQIQQATRKQVLQCI